MESDPKVIRSNEVINSILIDAIHEVVDLFADEMTDRDKQALESIEMLSGVLPNNRLVYLQQLTEWQGVSDKMGEYISQVKQTLRQKFNPGELEVCRTPFGASLLD